MTPLAGLRVLDFSKVLAGPLCAQWLGDLGAEVTKIEPPGGGDDTRGWPPFRGGVGAVFLSANRNKRSLTLDLKSAEGRAAVQRLVAQADVLIEILRHRRGRAPGHRRAGDARAATPASSTARSPASAAPGRSRTGSATTSSCRPSAASWR